MGEIVRLNESTLATLGMDRATVAGFRHIARQVGMALNAATLPDVAAQAELNESTLSVLQAAATALQALSAVLEANQAESPPPDRYARRIGELESEIDGYVISSAAMRRDLDEMRSEYDTLQITNNNLARRLATLENGVN